MTAVLLSIAFFVALVLTALTNAPLMLHRVAVVLLRIGLPLEGFVEMTRPGTVRIRRIHRRLLVTSFMLLGAVWLIILFAALEEFLFS